MHARAADPSRCAPPWPGGGGGRLPGGGGAERFQGGEEWRGEGVALAGRGCRQGESRQRHHGHTVLNFPNPWQTLGRLCRSD